MKHLYSIAIALAIAVTASAQQYAQYGFPAPMEPRGASGNKTTATASRLIASAEGQVAAMAGDSATYTYAPDRGWDAVWDDWKFDQKQTYKPWGTALDSFWSFYRKYDVLGRRTEQLWTIYDNTGKKFDTTDYMFYRYAGNKAKRKNTAPSDTTNLSYIVDYTFNAKGKKTEEIRQQRDQWMAMNPIYKGVFTYNAAGDIEDEDEYNPTATGGWTFGLNHHYTYNASGKVTEMMIRSKNGSAWVNTERYAYRYDASGRLTEIYLVRLDGGSTDTTIMHHNHYDANNDIDTLTITGYAVRGYPFRKRKYHSTYNSFKQPLVVTEYQWDDNLKKWGTASYQQRYYYEPYMPSGISTRVGYDKRISLYPVPATDYLQIEMAITKPQTLHFAIAFADGRIAQSWSVPAAGVNYKDRIDIKDLPAGNYLLRASSADGEAVRQFNVIK